MSILGDKTRTITRTAMVAVAAVAVLCVSAPAYAWDVQHDGNGRHVVSREASDTGAATITAYLRAGFLSSTGSHWSTGSFDDTSTGSSFAGATVVTIEVDASTKSFEYITAPGWMVQWALPNGEVVVNSASYWSQPVYLTSSSANSAYSQFVTNTPVTVLNSAASTVSVAGTLPVDVRSIAGDSELPLAALAAGGLALGVAAFRGFSWRS